jgi:HlyD family secretion protein
MDHTWWKRWPWFAAIAAAVALLAWAFAPRAVDADVAMVLRGPFEKTVDEDGKTRVRERYLVSAPLAGRLLRIGLKAGDSIERGTLVATLVPAAPSLLDARTMQELTERVGAAEAESARAAAGVERAQVALDLGQSELERGRSLAGQGFTSKQALERAEREVDLKTKELAAAQFAAHAAEHQQALARAALARARSGASERAAGERWDIRSPVKGQVLRVAQESETVVPVGASLVEVGDPHNLEAVVDVLTTDAVLVLPGADVRLDRGPGTPPLAGRVRRVEPSAFTKVSALGVEEQRVNIVIDFTSPASEWQDLGDAYKVDARIVVNRRSDAIIVPIGALFRRGQQWYVFVVDGGRAKLREIEPSLRGGATAVVLRGVEPGERVVVYPGDAVRDGVRIRVRDNAAPTARRLSRIKTRPGGWRKSASPIAAPCSARGGESAGRHAPARGDVSAPTCVAPQISWPWPSWPQASSPWASWPRASSSSMPWRWPASQRQTSTSPCAPRRRSIRRRFPTPRRLCAPPAARSASPAPSRPPSWSPASARCASACARYGARRGRRHALPLRAPHPPAARRA